MPDHPPPTDAPSGGQRRTGRITLVVLGSLLAPLFVLSALLDTVTEGAGNEVLLGLLGVGMAWGLFGIVTGLMLPHLGWRGGLLTLAAPTLYLLLSLIGLLESLPLSPMRLRELATPAAALVPATLGACAAAGYAAKVRRARGSRIALALLVAGLVVLLGWPGWGCHGRPREYHCHPAFGAWHLH